MKDWFKNFLLKIKGTPISIEAETSKRKELDDRLDDLTKATIDGEEKWFLQLVKRNPNCAMNVIKECKDGFDTDK